MLQPKLQKKGLGRGDSSSWGGWENMGLSVLFYRQQEGKSTGTKL